MTSSPFVGLNPFTVEQSEYFFGRAEETALLEANLRSSRVTLLYGPSGVGKTSLLTAGLVASLVSAARENVSRRGKPGFLPVLFRTWQDEVSAGIAEAIWQQWGAIVPDTRIGLPGPEAGLPALLRAWAGTRGGDLLLILDQFELSFVYGASVQEGGFMDVLARSVADSGLPLNLLVSIREDWLSALDVFKGRLPGLFENYLRLKKLNREGATAAIERPVERYNKEHGTSIAIEAGLVEAVLARSVETGRMAPPDTVRPGLRALLGRRRRPPRDTPVLPDASFEAPALQIIMQRLWNEDISGDAGALRGATLARLTQESDIVDQYVQTVMRPLRARERRLASILVDRLVTPSGTKVAMTLGDLASLTGRSREKLQAVIDRLAPLLNDVVPPRGITDRCFEISHDVLAPALSKWQVGFAQRRRLWQIGGVAGLFALIAAAAVAFGVYSLSQSERLEATVRQLQGEQARRAVAESRLAELSRSNDTAPPIETPPTPGGPSTPSPGSPAPASADSRELGALSRATLWKNGSTLRVRFLDGEPALQSRVQRFAEEWTQFANLTFSFGTAPDAEVRVSFKERGNSWAYVGIQGLASAADEPTVNLGFLDVKSSDDDVRRDVLHEFGHVLGLVHELNQPNAAIPWNRAKVYASFAAPPYFWPRDTVDFNILGRHRQGDFPSKSFDPRSIMMFPIPRDLTDGRFEAGTNHVLSEGDKAFIAQLYPGR